MAVVDTRYYWKLTEHIFRYGHSDGNGGGSLGSGVHTVNEGELVFFL
jgi:Gly-Xaa carboxypeptidase